MTIETWLEHHPRHEPPGDIITLVHGTFGPTGHRVRLLVLKDGVLIEASGETRFLKASEQTDDQIRAEVLRNIHHSESTS